MRTNGATICPVCGAEKTKTYCAGYDMLYQMTKDEFAIKKCSVCRALFISPFPTQAETATFYPETYYSYETGETKGFFSNLKRKIIQTIFEPNAKLSLFDKVLVSLAKNKFSGIPLYRKKNGNFLDIGCGSGENLRTLKKYGWNVYGIELDPKAVEFAKSQSLNVQCVSLEAADFGETKFDAIRIWHVFEHLTDPNLALGKMSALLTEDGEIIMAVPNADSFPRKIFRTFWYGFDVPRHVIDYSPYTLDFILKKHQMKITEIKYVSCGGFVGSISNFLRYNFGYKGNLVDNIFLIALFFPLDFLSDLLGKGDTIFLKIKKHGL